MLVGNLAEAATEAVGGNSLLARVGAYYHDVGKTKRPYFFIENQMGIVNPHDKTSPTLSTLIITAHVRDGVEMAKEHGIPERIIEFIREHHGNTLVSYFFTRATGGDSATEYAEQDFRYEGPRPTSKETAIVMLADSVEAAVRSMGTLPAGRIESVVKKIVRDKLNDHQLDKCDLTLGDLDVISEVFTSVLSGIFHPRIEYPEEKPVVEAKAGTETQNGSRSNSLKKKRPGIRRSARRA
ncbi:MAG: HDIG domain-containing protein [Bacillota bacterium]|nr:HDIG domain-containing protein [Bacillota bacterium]